MASVAQGAGHRLGVGPGRGPGGAVPGREAGWWPAFTLDGLEVTQETVLWEDAERVEFRTHVDGYTGHDRLLRVRFPADVPGGLPVYQTATAVIGRSFGAVDVDSADTWYTLDNPAYDWFGLGSAARVRTGGTAGRSRPSGWPRSICPDGGPGAGLQEVIRDLMVALAGAGVTATCSQADGPRYGGLDADSNLPDVRIARRRPGREHVHRRGLVGGGPRYAKAVAAWRTAAPGCGCPRRAAGRTPSGPDADVRGAADLPVLIVAGGGPDELAAAVGRPGRGPGRRSGGGGRGHRRRRRAARRRCRWRTGRWRC